MPQKQEYSLRKCKLRDWDNKSLVNSQAVAWKYKGDIHFQAINSPFSNTAKE